MSVVVSLKFVEKCCSCHASPREVADVGWSRNLFLHPLKGVITKLVVTNVFNRKVAIMPVYLGMPWRLLRVPYLLRLLSSNPTNDA